MKIFTKTDTQAVLRHLARILPPVAARCREVECLSAGLGFRVRVQGLGSRVYGLNVGSFGAGGVLAVWGLERVSRAISDTNTTIGV